MSTPAPSSLPNLQDVDLRLLRVFEAVARNRGLSSAQRDLGVTQATISQQLACLEGRLGLRLCERGRGGFALTAEGRDVLAAARTLFRSIENFRSAVGSTRGELLGELHFGTVDAMWSNETLNLPGAFAEFSAFAPGVIVHIDIDAPQSLVQGLAEDRYQLILAPALDHPNRFNAVPLFAETQGLYCGRSHELFTVPDAEIALDRLVRYRYAARDYMSGQPDPVGESFRSTAFTSHMESIALLVLSGGYLGHLPTHFARQWEAQGRMRRLCVRKVSYDDQFHLISRKRETNRAAMILFDCISGCCHRSLVTSASTQ
ncbi:MAG: LysR family transcriptional regulator [bacterium]|nr:LysR family transcriptional regulator [bacterium]MDE0416543.1 LysR family transcriptional regulator [bacterium]